MSQPSIVFQALAACFQASLAFCSSAAAPATSFASPKASAADSHADAVRSHADAQFAHSAEAVLRFFSDSSKLSAFAQLATALRSHTAADFSHDTARPVASTAAAKSEVSEPFFAQLEKATPPLALPGEPIDVTDLPADRLGVLRTAFMAMVKSQPFLDDAKKQTLDVNPLDGEALQAIVVASTKASPKEIARARAAVAAPE